MLDSADRFHVLLGTWLIALIAALLFAVVGTAATPSFDATWQGNTVHNKYTLDIEATCWTAKTPGVFGKGCDTSTNVYINELQPNPPHGSKCPAAGNSFSNVTLTPFKLTSNGSFSGTGYFSTGKPQLTFTVKGRFVSPNTVKGTVIGNFGCGTDTFALTIPGK